MIKNVEKKFSKKLQSYNLINFFRFFSSMIEFKKITILFIILLKIGYLSKKQIRNFLIGIFSTIILKNFFRRKRPFKNYQSIKNYDKKYFDEYSFPSGHSFTAFYIALVLCCKINNLIVKNTILVISLIISLSRVYLGVHYASDVLFSLILARYIINFNGHAFY
tara:strand:- start:35 stop:526 length:492 start_codon:yes stop_codon:yes gene_type:complete